MAGKRIIDDDRNKLYRDYFRVLKIINPTFFVIENVTGILNLNGGAVKEDIIKRSNETGYKVFIKTLCAVEHGVPQNRKRVFFIGIKKNNLNGEFIFPEELNNKISCEDAISDLPRLDLLEDNKKYRCDPQSDYQKMMRKNSQIVYNHEQSKHKKETIETISHVPEGGGMKNIPEELRGNRNYSSLLRRMDRSKPSQTIDTGHRTYFHYEENRIISVREAARLQSFPDTYEFLGSKQYQYKQVGNAVPPILAYEVAKSIRRYFAEEK
jgi:DNA (cytosine-5)-methyltransferase 1